MVRRWPHPSGMPGGAGGIGLSHTLRKSKKKPAPALRKGGSVEP